jgi:outer membrane immunogenic protein
VYIFEPQFLIVTQGGAVVKKFIAVVTAIAAFGFVNAASAADMPTKAPMAAPIAAPVYNWTGLYVGGVVGYGWAKAQHCDYGPPDVCIPVTDMKGWNGGITLGYNWQWANWVLGVEGDWSWANLTGHSPDPPGFGCGTSCDNKIKSFETARVRAGYAFDRFLPYVTAGAGWSQLNASIGNPVVASGSTTKTSFVVGAGLEYAFWQNFSAKLEYLYFSRLGDFAYDTIGACGVPGCHLQTGAINLVRFGLNYRFTGL